MLQLFENDRSQYNLVVIKKILPGLRNHLNRYRDPGMQRTTEGSRWFLINKEGRDGKKGGKIHMLDLQQKKKLLDIVRSLPTLSAIYFTGDK